LFRCSCSISEFVNGTETDEVLGFFSGEGGGLDAEYGADFITEPPSSSRSDPPRSLRIPPLISSTLVLRRIHDVERASCLLLRVTGILPFGSQQEQL
jgi:hypothetical protein